MSWMAEIATEEILISETNCQFKFSRDFSIGAKNKQKFDRSVSVEIFLQFFMASTLGDDLSPIAAQRINLKRYCELFPFEICKRLAFFPDGQFLRFSTKSF